MDREYQAMNRSYGIPLLSGHLRARSGLVLLTLLTLPFSALPLAGQATTTSDPAVVVGEFDFGKMWTFEYPPAEHFSSTYGIDASPEWFERARMAALRIPGCSASFVSPNGLMVTNHHCARGAIASVTQDGENLLDDGFYASTLEEERPIPRYYADQLLAALDVTDELEQAMAAAPGATRQEAQEGIRARLAGEYGEEALIQFVALYNGARTSAYVIRRYTDVRLVAAVELAMGFFGGDPDNFTYPRYALDYAFYRVYDEDGEPLETAHWFRWGDGVAPGDPIFMVGNPGPTNRLLTVDQLAYQRDHLVPGRKAYFESRLEALRDAYAADPAEGERLGLRNRAFSLSNSLKAYTGRLEALQNPQIMARKGAAESALSTRIEGDPEQAAELARIMDGLAEVQVAKRELAPEMNALYRLGDPTYGSRALLRALNAAQLQAMTESGTRADSLEMVRDEIRSIQDHPGDLEEDLLRMRLVDLARYLGTDHPALAAILQGRSPEGAATALLEGSVLQDQASTIEALVTGPRTVPPTDAMMALARELLPLYFRHQTRAAPLDQSEQELNADLGRLRFRVYGTRIAPDATSSPRITDGVVTGYEYNGTEAPTHTTLFGVYDRYYSHLGSSDEWNLPERWLPVPDGLDLTTALNFISTADSYGGNSGSPALTRDLEIVGLNFDRNIQGLSRDFIYLADRIVLEIDTGRMAASEEEADRIRAGG
jgi:hypothetical protein